MVQSTLLIFWFLEKVGPRGSIMPIWSFRANLCNMVKNCENVVSFGGNKAVQRTRRQLILMTYNIYYSIFTTMERLCRTHLSIWPKKAPTRLHNVIFWPNAFQICKLTLKLWNLISFNGAKHSPDFLISWQSWAKGINYANLIFSRKVVQID